MSTNTGMAPVEQHGARPWRRRCSRARSLRLPARCPAASRTTSSACVPLVTAMPCFALMKGGKFLLELQRARARRAPPDAAVEHAQQRLPLAIVVLRPGRKRFGFGTGDHRGGQVQTCWLCVEGKVVGNLDAALNIPDSATLARGPDLWQNDIIGAGNVCLGQSAACPSEAAKTLCRASDRSRHRSRFRELESVIRQIDR